MENCKAGTLPILMHNAAPWKPYSRLHKWFKRGDVENESSTTLLNSPLFADDTKSIEARSPAVFGHFGPNAARTQTLE
jgi:hypothetical protein